VRAVLGDESGEPWNEMSLAPSTTRWAHGDIPGSTTVPGSTVKEPAVAAVESARIAGRTRSWVLVLAVFQTELEGR